MYALSNNIALVLGMTRTVGMTRTERLGPGLSVLCCSVPALSPLLSHCIWEDTANFVCRGLFQMFAPPPLPQALSIEQLLNPFSHDKQACNFHTFPPEDDDIES